MIHRQILKNIVVNTIFYLFKVMYFTDFNSESGEDSMKAPQPPPGDLGPPGSSKDSILQWVRNKNNQEDIYLKKALEFHQRELVFKMIKLEEERLDWHAFLKQLKECNSDDMSEFAG